MEKIIKKINKKLEKAIIMLDYEVYSAEEVSNLLKDIYWDYLPKLVKEIEDN